MRYQCSGCHGSFEYHTVKKGVHAICPECQGDLVEAAAGSEPASLVVKGNGGASSRHPANSGTTIGRDPTSAIVLDDGSVSTRHAVLREERKVLCVIDCESTNGTFVNGVRVSIKALRHGDEVCFGRVSATFEDPSAASGGGESPRTVDLLQVEDGISSVQAQYRPGSTVCFSPGEELSAAHPEAAKLARAHRALELTAALAGIQDQDQLLESLARDLFEMFGVERVVVLLREPQLRTFTVGLARTRDGAPIEALNLSRTLMRKVIGERLSLVTSDVSLDGRFVPSGSLLASGTRSALVSPLLCGEEVLGLVWSDTVSDARTFDEGDLPIFSGLVGVAGVSLANARLCQRVATEARARSHLSRYLSPELVQQVMDQKVSMQMGGSLADATVLFCDMRGFTAASEKASPEQVVQMLNRYFGRMVEVVFRNGGTVDKFIGDAIMAVWGVPQARPTDAFAAVRAGIEMQRELADYNRESLALGLPEVAMGVGIHSGPVVAGNIGSPRRMEFTVIGDTVNTASRVESSTGAGDVFLTKETLGRLGRPIPVKALPPIKVKNKAVPLELFAVDFGQLVRTPDRLTTGKILVPK